MFLLVFAPLASLRGEGLCLYPVHPLHPCSNRFFKPLSHARSLRSLMTQRRKGKTRKPFNRDEWDKRDKPETKDFGVNQNLLFPFVFAPLRLCAGERIKVLSPSSLFEWVSSLHLWCLRHNRLLVKRARCLRFRLTTCFNV